MIRPITVAALAVSLAVPALAGAQSLRGSSTSVDLMYQQALAHGLHFYETATGIRRAADRGAFVKMSGNADYELASVSHPYVLPITRTFVHRLSAQYRARCGEKLVVTSGIRPKSMRLANGAERSVHPTGMAIDLRKPTRGPCLAWLRETLSYLDARGLIEATEEHRPPHFHVAVFPEPYAGYVGGDAGRIASSRPASSAPAGAGPGKDASTATYRVRPGDSLWSIARARQLTVEELKRANSLRSSRIMPGQVLVLPGSASDRD